METGHNNTEAKFPQPISENNSDSPSDSEVEKNTSSARGSAYSDVSTITFGSTRLSRLDSQFSETSLESSRAATDSEDLSNVHVVVRVRPLSESEQHRHDVSAVEFPGDNQIWVNDANQKTKPFTFTQVFEPATSQDEFFESCGVKQLVDLAIAGYACTVFAYGQTGSGKTHTITGPFAWDQRCELESYGLIQRSLAYLFDRISNNTASITLKASYLEIYNEQVQDLLNPADGHNILQIRWSKSGGFYVENLFLVECETMDDLMAVLEEGLSNRQTGSNLMNEHSSRSHSMLQLYIDSEVSNLDDESLYVTKQGKLTFVDLAGSEKLNELGSSGQLVTETTNINKSLLTLGNCISALSDPKKRGGHIPYRDSKLTKLLADSLGGTGVTLMVACISPSSYSISESLNTLRYANRAKKIKNKPVVRMDPREKLILGLRHAVKHLQNENDFLKGQLSIRRPPTKGPAPPRPAAGGAAPPFQQAPPLKPLPSYRQDNDKTPTGQHRSPPQAGGAPEEFYYQGGGQEPGGRHKKSSSSSSSSDSAAKASPEFYVKPKDSSKDLSKGSPGNKGYKENGNPAPHPRQGFSHSASDKSAQSSVTPSSHKSAADNGLYEMLQEYMVENENLRSENSDLQQVKDRSRRDHEYLSKENERLFRKLEDLERVFVTSPISFGVNSLIGSQNNTGPNTPIQSNQHPQHPQQYPPQQQQQHPQQKPHQPHPPLRSSPREAALHISPREAARISPREVVRNSPRGPVGTSNSDPTPSGMRQAGEPARKQGLPPVDTVKGVPNGFKNSKFYTQQPQKPKQPSKKLDLNKNQLDPSLAESRGGDNGYTEKYQQHQMYSKILNETIQLQAQGKLNLRPGIDDALIPQHQPQPLQKITETSPRKDSIPPSYTKRAQESKQLKGDKNPQPGSLRDIPSTPTQPPPPVKYKPRGSQMRLLTQSTMDPSHPNSSSWNDVNNVLRKELQDLDGEIEYMKYMNKTQVPAPNGGAGSGPPSLGPAAPLAPVPNQARQQPLKPKKR